MTKLIVAKVLVLVSLVIIGIDAHGRFLKPPNRSSIWRIPEFDSQNPPKNYNDNQLYCGGIHQADEPGSNCGHCGDNKADPQPRENEYKGLWYSGIIVGDYTSGQTIDVEVELTTSHLGHMEWRLCTNPENESQECFNQHLLTLASGGTQYPVGETGMYKTRVVLPQGVKCDHCVIQWNYRAGNGWGDCGNGTSATGCGPMETFRGCSDVIIR